ncbi:MAG: SCO family protein, partial [Pseudomonadota bacterium]|nr:SCO family protein [Pseudomonadota bacterium]
MNRRTMIRNHTPLLAALLALAACQQSAPAQPPLAGAAIGEEFTLTGETGEDVSWSDFDGQYRTLYFGYTYCPDVCPVDTQRAMAGLKAFEQA